MPKTPFGKVAKQKVREMDAQEKAKKMATSSNSKETVEIITICPAEEIVSGGQFDNAKMKELMEGPSKDDGLLALKNEKIEAKAKMLAKLASQEEEEKDGNEDERKLNLEEAEIFEEEDENNETVL